jgi:hypothetical protein
MSASMSAFPPRCAAAALALLLLASCGGGGGSPGVTGAGSFTGTGNTSGQNTGTNGSANTGTTPGAVAGSTAVGFTLTGANEIPSNASLATGAGTMTIDLVTGNFTASVTTAGMLGTAANIQAGTAGMTNGPIIFPMVQTAPGGTTWITSGRLTSAQVATLNAGGYYMNVSSASFPNGEIRAQIVPPQFIVLQTPATSTGTIGNSGFGGTF